MSIKIGVLLPASAIYPTINFDLVAGMRTAFEASGRADYEIRTENIGIGGNDKLIYGQCEKLLMEGVTIVTGYINPMTAEKLQPLFLNGNAILVALDAGYHFRMNSEKLANIFFLSLQGALCSRIITRVAINEGVQSFAFTSSYYETGYRSSFGFYKTIESGKAVITQHHFTLLNRSEFTLEPLRVGLQQYPTDGVFASFCGDMLEDFCLNATGVFNTEKVYGSSFMGEEQWLEKSAYPGTDIKVCIPWASTINNKENQQVKDMLGKQNRKMNIFSLLGYEAGVVINAALGAENTDDRIKRLEGFSFDSPRGVVTLNADTHECIAPVYESVIEKNEETGKCQLGALTKSELTESERADQIKDISATDRQFTSWLNAYACLES